MSPTNFQYRARPAEAWDKRASGKLFEGYALDQFPTLSLKDENTIRILPPTWEDPQHYGIDLWVHYGVGPGNATVICLHRMRGEKCPVCEAWARAEEQGREDAKELKPTRRVLVWLIDRADEKNPFLWAMPQSVDTSIASICRDRMSGELYQIDHPDAGFDVYFQRKQKGGGAMFVEYVGFQLARRPTQVEQKYIDYISQHPLPSALNWRTYEEIERLFLGGAVNEEKPVQQAPGAPAPTPVQSAPVAAVPPPPPTQFVSEYTGGHCSTCHQPQYTFPGGVTCQSGHVNVPAIEEQQAPPPPVVATPPPPPPPSVVTMPAPAGPTNGQINPPPAPAPNVVSRTAALRARFDTGKGR